MAGKFSEKGQEVLICSWEYPNVGCRFMYNTCSGDLFDGSVRRYEVSTMMNIYIEQLQLPYNALAQILNCSPRNIAILQSATSAWAQV